jgi:pimeloyl-ACP methyl ester carboxylesterase
MRYIFLHGFASGPTSEKAAFLRGRFQDCGRTLETPTLVPGEFSQLTITGKLAELERALSSPPESTRPQPKPTAIPRDTRPPAANNESRRPTAASGSSGTLARPTAASGSSVTLVGSSLGGYVATLYAEKHPGRIDRLILLAPAFGFPTRWLERGANLPANPDDPDCKLTLTEAWQQTGFHTVYHHEKQQDEQIGYQLVTDAEQYPDFPKISPDIPILILHGNDDETVPVEYAKKFVEQNPHATLITLDADHRLTDPAILETVWTESKPFLDL